MAADESSAAPPARQGADEQEHVICWICQDPEKQERLVAPCRCDGSLRGVHASCIERWVATRQREALRVNQRPLPGMAASLVDSSLICDLCGAQYQADHRPAELWGCLQAHWRDCRQSLANWSATGQLRQLTKAIFLAVFLFAVLIVSTLLVTDIWAAAWQPSGSLLGRCLATAALSACLIIFAFEAAIIFVSFPWSSEAPSNCLLRAFFIPADANEQHLLVVMFLMLHLWLAPALPLIIGLLMSVMPLQDDTVGSFSWNLLPAFFLLPILAQAKLLAPQVQACRQQGLCQRRADCCLLCRQGCRSCCSRETRSAMIDFLRVILLNPKLPWLQMLIAMLFGLTWDWPSAPSTGQLVVVFASSSLGCLVATYAWIQLCIRGPQHEDYDFPYRRDISMHWGWLAVFAILVYWGLGAFVERSVEPHINSIKPGAFAFVTWAAWCALVGSLGVYANCSAALAYVRRWRAQNGTFRISGDVATVN